MIKPSVVRGILAAYDKARKEAVVMSEDAVWRYVTAETAEFKDELKADYGAFVVGIVSHLNKIPGNE